MSDDKASLSSSLGPVSVSANYRDGRKAKTAPGEIARRFADLIAEGVSVTDASAQLGLSGRAILGQKEVQQAVRDLLVAGRLPAEIRKEMVRAGVNLAFIQATMEGDRKGVSDLAKVIGADPEVAIGGEGTKIQIGVGIELGPLEKVLEGLPEQEEK